MTPAVPEQGRGRPVAQSRLPLMAALQCINDRRKQRRAVRRRHTCIARLQLLAARAAEAGGCLIWLPGCSPVALHAQNSLHTAQAQIVKLQGSREKLQGRREGQAVQPGEAWCRWRREGVSRRSFLGSPHRRRQTGAHQTVRSLHLCLRSTPMTQAAECHCELSCLVHPDSELSR